MISTLNIRPGHHLDATVVIDKEKQPVLIKEDSLIGMMMRPMIWPGSYYDTPDLSSKKFQGVLNALNT